MLSFIKINMGTEIKQLKSRKILFSSVDCKSSKFCPTFKPNTPMESVILLFSTGTKFLLFLFTLDLFVPKTMLPF